MIQENQKDLAMTKEEKDLVMKDLCSRLPYGVYVQIVDRVGFTHTLVELNPEVIQKMWSYKSIKPYLRPISSMPEEEREFLNKMALENSLKCIEEEDPQKVFLLRIKHDAEELAYLYEHHYDVNGLIPSGHAIEVTEDNNPYKD